MPNLESIVSESGSPSHREFLPTPTIAPGGGVAYPAIGDGRRPVPQGIGAPVNRYRVGLNSQDGGRRGIGTSLATRQGLSDVRHTERISGSITMRQTSVRDGGSVTIRDGFFPKQNHCADLEIANDCAYWWW